MAFVAGAKGSLVEYKTRIGRRCFWSKILNFGLGFDIAGAQNRSLRISADFCDLCAVRRPYGAYGTATFLMTPFDVLDDCGRFSHGAVDVPDGSIRPVDGSHADA
jgi:hypothetical protein